MGQRLALAKAASLLGIKRRDLQELIHKGELNTFEGMVDLDELCQCFPAMALNDNAALERVNLIRETAFGRRVSETVALDADSLEQQLRKCNADLSIASTQVKKYRGYIEELARRLGELNRTATSEQKQVIGILNNWLLDKLEQ
ncbi:putative flavodoxin oxidoreductase [Thioalkalivibrio nitratireducens DSM 14787]|uniref:Flavodoxin oxidoreductase n=1 Tax=Thioalkalivibrio nitratireducens (strain DSM 14787 / UNIQEM 213 / ALEN2) TaxID=1255043 RepID=L0DWI2_THIND|nr:hypothetical protein [Thioalkalivibrio nitratireducens]AGA33335.1 putative flavodoxin oxidoreductase [Thioalkalivibrio nitratireducens DSM 14787]